VEHSPIGPSTAGYWAPEGACTGFVQMAANYPEDVALSSGGSVEGNVAHGLGERKIRDVGLDLHALIDTLDGETGVLITEEMVEAVELYVGDIAPYKSSVKVEERVHAPGIHENMWGTVDAFYIDLINNKIIIWDFKFGYGVVEVFENWQLMAYSYGVLSSIPKYNQTVTADWVVEMRIVQPRAYHVDGPIRSWTMTVGDLHPYYTQMQRAAMETTGPQAVCRPSKRCKYCPARHACKALKEQSYSAADYAAAPTPELLDADAVALELNILTDAERALSNRMSGIKAQVEQLINGGAIVPGWQLKRTIGRKIWTDAEGARGLAEMLGVDITKAAYITPNQAVKKGMPQDVVDSYSARNTGSAKLDQLTNQKLRKVFK